MLITTAVGLVLMARIVAARGPEILKPIFLPCFALLFAWIALSFWSGVVGFLLGVLRRHPVTLARRSPAAGDVPPLRERTAILVPVYNEDPAEVSGRLAVMQRSLQATGHAAAFDFFILSDTTNAEIAAEEERIYGDLRERLGAETRLFYRRRAQNTGKKAGNIAEWIGTRGPDYAFMIVLDADSLLDGDTMVRLAALMEANPRTGLIQTHIVPAGRETLFARALQFTSRMTGVVLSMGNSFWQTSEANYFGHNAILRVAAFAAVLPPAGALRPAAVRRRDPEPRFRRSGLPAARRLALLAPARAARQLRGAAQQPARLRGARPPLDAGQPAACPPDQPSPASTG